MLGGFSHGVLAFRTAAALTPRYFCRLLVGFKPIYNSNPPHGSLRYLFVECDVAAGWDRHWDEPLLPKLGCDFAITYGQIHLVAMLLSRLGSYPASRPSGILWTCFFHPLSNL